MYTGSLLRSLGSGDVRGGSGVSPTCGRVGWHAGFTDAGGRHEVPGSETQDSVLLVARAAAVCAGPCILSPWMTPAHTAGHVTGEEPSLTGHWHGAPEGTGPFLQGVPDTQLSSGCLAPRGDTGCSRRPGTCWPYLIEQSAGTVGLAFLHTCVCLLAGPGPALATCPQGRQSLNVAAGPAQQLMPIICTHTRKAVTLEKTCHNGKNPRNQSQLSLFPLG